MYRLDEVFSDVDSPCIVFKRGVEHGRPKATVGYRFRIFIVDLVSQERLSVSPKRLYELAEKNKVVGTTKLDEYLCVSIISQRAVECLSLVNCLGVVSAYSFNNKIVNSLSDYDKSRLVKLKGTKGLRLVKADFGVWKKEFGVFVSASRYISIYMSYLGRDQGSYRIFEASYVDRKRVLGESNILDAMIYSNKICAFYNSGKNLVFPVYSDSVCKYCIFECSPKLMLGVCS